MEILNIQKWLENGSGAGDGSGDGFDAGSGYGDGSGYGSGYGYGSGAGFGDGSGDRDGSGYSDCDGVDIKIFCGNPIYLIGRIPTIITAVLGCYAKGYILEPCLTLTPCYIAKKESHFAHGKTLNEAVAAVMEKAFDDMPEEERIAEFWKCHENGVKYPARDLYDWHHRLTGSCEMGRKTFAAERGIRLAEDTFTVEEFVELCKDNYGGKTIRKLMEDEQ